MVERLKSCNYLGCSDFDPKRSISSHYPPAFLAQNRWSCVVSNKVKEASSETSGKSLFCCCGTQSALLQRSDELVFLVFVYHMLFVGVLARFGIFYTYHDLHIVAARACVSGALSYTCVFGYLCHGVYFLQKQITCFSSKRASV
jgi:hypothetical protein